MKLVKNTGSKPMAVYFYRGQWHRANLFTLTPTGFCFTATYSGVLRGWGYVNETA